MVEVLEWDGEDDAQPAGEQWTPERYARWAEDAAGLSNRELRELSYRIALGLSRPERRLLGEACARYRTGWSLHKHHLEALVDLAERCLGQVVEPVPLPLAHFHQQGKSRYVVADPHTPGRALQKAHLGVLYEAIARPETEITARALGITGERPSKYLRERVKSALGLLRETVPTLYQELDNGLAALTPETDEVPEPCIIYSPAGWCRVSIEAPGVYANRTPAQKTA